MTGQRAELVRQVHATACRHADGLAIGTTVAALCERGVLALLAARPRISFAELCDRFGANPGFLHVAVRLLADQGWVLLRGGPGAATLELETTLRGREVFTGFAPAYSQAAAFLPVAQRLDDVLRGAAPDDELGRYLAVLRSGWGLEHAAGSRSVRHQVLAHLRGHVLGPLLVHALRLGLLRADAELMLTDRTLRWAAAILAGQGWVRMGRGTARLTPKGELASAYASQYGYPLVYLPLLRRVPDLIFGDLGPRGGEDAETHLDRALDVRFSGDVFSATCRRPFLDAALPLFNRLPLDEQPSAVVDTGCGDGTVLAALHTAVRSSTARGRELAQHPLLMVAVDPSPVAREIAARTLAAAGVAHLVLDGDIADPDRLDRDLAAHGVDARGALHVCKSAIHDRGFEAPEPGASHPPASLAAYADADGADLDAADVARGLAQLMRRWRPLTERHGWLVIEAHAAPPATAVRLMGRTLSTTLTATHGYSCQYPVEPEVFAWAAREAGFTSRVHARPGAAQLGYTALTVDHFVAG